jgi:hypothetical protein
VTRYTDSGGRSAGDARWVPHEWSGGQKGPSEFLCSPTWGRTRQKADPPLPHPLLTHPSHPRAISSNHTRSPNPPPPPTPSTVPHQSHAATRRTSAAAPWRCLFRPPAPDHPRQHPSPHHSSLSRDVWTATACLHPIFSVLLGHPRSMTAGPGEPHAQKSVGRRSFGGGAACRRQRPSAVKRFF